MPAVWTRLEPAKGAHCNFRMTRHPTGEAQISGMATTCHLIRLLQRAHILQGVGFAGMTTMQPAGASPTRKWLKRIKHALAASTPVTLTVYWSGVIIHLECLPKRKRSGSNCCKERSTY